MHDLAPERLPDKVETVSTPSPEAPATRTLNRSLLLRTFTLVLLALAFATSVRSWLQFYDANGGPIGLFTQTDYPAITIASRLAVAGQGGQLYNLEAQLQEQKKLTAEGYLSLSPTQNATLNYPYPYTPFIAVLWSPLVGLSPLTGMAVWDILNIACMVLGLWLLLWSLPLPVTTRLFILLAALTSYPFIVNLEQGQSSGITILGLAGGIALMKRERDLPAGLLLGLLVVKIQWLPLLALVLLWKRRWWTLLGAALTSGGLSLVVFLTIGAGWLPSYLSILQEAQQWSRALLLDPLYSHSLGGALVALLGTGAESAVRMVNTLVMLGLAGLLVWLWRGKWEPNGARWDGLMALTVLATMLTNLHLNTHDLCLLALPAALGLSYIHQSKRSDSAKTTWYALIWAAYLLTSGLPIPTHGLNGPMETLFGLAFGSDVRVITLTIGTMVGLLVWLLVRQTKNVPTLQMAE